MAPAPVAPREQPQRLRPFVKAVCAPDERLYLVDHYITYCHAHILHLEAEIDEFLREQAGFWSQSAGERFQSMMQHRVRMWKLEMEWAQALRAKLVD